MNSELRELLKTLLEQEQMLISLYTKVLGMTDDKEITIPIKKIISDESKHASNAKKMIDILES